MMINCPKCNLLQPKDQYCAQCGINMETWRPPEDPSWKKLLGNWIFQLGVLFIVVLLVVLRDVFFTKKPIPAAENIASISDNYEPTQQPSQYAASTRQETPEEIPTPETPSPTPIQSNRMKVVGVRKEMISKEKGIALERRATYQVVFIDRNILEKMYQNSKRVDANALVISKGDYDKIVRTAKGTKSIGNETREFVFSQPRQFFIGENDTETGIGFGFYLQLRVLENSQPNSIHFEVNTWNQLKLTGDPGPQTSIDVNMNSDSYLVVVDSTANDQQFTPEERSLFDTSDRLRSLNSERFINDLTDIALVLAIQ